MCVNTYPTCSHAIYFTADGFKLPKKAKLSHLPDIDPLLEEKMELLLGSSPGVSLEQTNNTNEANNIEVPRIEVNNKRYESPQKTSTSPNNENHDNDEDNDEKENKKPELVKTNSKVSLESVLEYWAVDASEVNKESNMLLGQGHFANVYKGTFRVRNHNTCHLIAELIMFRVSKSPSSVLTKRSQTASSCVNWLV